MATSPQTKILSTIRRNEFLGRTHALDELLRTAASDEAGGILVSAAPGAGLSELFRQVYDELFHQQKVLPIYFEFRRTDESSQLAARRFVHEFLVQSLAFLRADPSLIVTSPPTGELAELGRPIGNWYSAAIEQLAGSDNVTSLFNAPARAAAAGVKTFVMFDSVDVVDTLDGGPRLIEDINGLARNYPMAIGALRRFSGIAELPVRLQLDRLPVGETAEVVNGRAARIGVEVSDQTRDLIAVQFDRDLSLISSFISRATKGGGLQSFREFSRLYGQELVSGILGRRFDDLFDEILADSRLQRDLIENLYYGVVRNERLVWERPGDIPAEDFQRAEELLDLNEVINIEAGLVLRDYVTARHRISVETRNPGTVISEIVTTTLKRAPQIMARHYRQISSLGLKGLLSSFDCQEVPAALLDYRAFRDVYKGLPDPEILASARNDLDKVTLPQIAHVDFTSEFYAPIAQVTDTERSVVGVGFIGRNYTDEDEIAWLAAEIESKLEVELDVVEFWCDRLDVVALSANFRNYRIWLISPEGFTDEAISMLRMRRGIGSSRKQFELLAQYIGSGSTVGKSPETDEYEIVVPMGEDTELIAAHAVEEVAKRRNFPSKAINQIKTALVEACINAAEHSLSPDRKIYQKFVVDKNKIVITVSNRGIRMTDRAVTMNDPGTGRRGWGLNLMRGLMDEVKIEQVDDGTRISMTKYLQ